MKEYTYFNSKVLQFLDDKNGETVNTPKFVKRAAKNYRYDHTRQILQKKCISCGKYYDVQKYNGNKFEDIHDESVIHFYSEESGYGTRCTMCNSDLTNKTELKEQKEECDSKSHANLYLTEDNLLYVKIVAVLEKQTEEECLNNILDVVRKYNTLSYDYVKKIK